MESPVAYSLMPAPPGEPGQRAVVPAILLVFGWPLGQLAASLALTELRSCAPVFRYRSTGVFSQCGCPTSYRPSVFFTVIVTCLRSPATITVHVNLLPGSASSSGGHNASVASIV